MVKDEDKDYQFFECDQQQDLDYVASLYEEKDRVYDLLREERDSNNITYSTHVDIYELIEKNLAILSLPDGKPFTVNRDCQKNYSYLST